MMKWTFGILFPSSVIMQFRSQFFCLIFLHANITFCTPLLILKALVSEQLDTMLYLK